ncbi:MAG: hypothetical protein ACK4ND_06330 [Cytophagaceae bacterium]
MAFSCHAEVRSICWIGGLVDSKDSVGERTVKPGTENESEFGII